MPQSREKPLAECSSWSEECRSENSSVFWQDMQHPNLSQKGKPKK